MTISSNNRKAGPFIGNGSAATFPFTFKVFQASDLFVVRLTVSTGAQSTLVLGTDYTVTLNLEQDSNPGGSITLVAGALASGYNLIITSDIGNLQPTDLTNQGGFYLNRNELPPGHAIMSKSNTPRTSTPIARSRRPQT